MHRSRLFVVMILVGAILAMPPVSEAATLRIEGTVLAESPVQTVTVRAWALGAGPIRHPEWAVKPLAEVQTPSGRPFALDLPQDALPVRVELSAPGFVAVARTVALAEDCTLEPAWLRRGAGVTVRVRHKGRPVAGAVVRGTLRAGPWSERPGRWSPAFPATVLPASGATTVVVPPQGADGLTVSAFDPATGAWGEHSEVKVSPKTVFEITLDTEPAPVLVRDGRGRPVPGALVAAAAAPPGAAVRTGKDGRAKVPLPPGSWRVVALAGQTAAVLRGHGRPAKGLTLDMEPLKSVRFRWEPSLGDAVFDADFLPAALGLTPVAGRGGSAALPFLGGGRCAITGPGIAPVSVAVSRPGITMDLGLQPAVTVEGRAVLPGGEPAPAGLPVWITLPPERLTVRRGGQGFHPATPHFRPWLPWAVTDAAGQFRIQSLPAAPFALDLRKAGTPPARSGVLTPKPGQRLEVTLVLRPGAMLTGRVTGPDGEPLEGVTAEVFHVEPENTPHGTLTFSFGSAQPQPDPDAAGSTDAQGQLMVRQVPQGTVRVVLRRSGFVTRTLSKVEVPPEGADLGEIEMERGVTIRGTTVDPEGRPVPNAEVALLETPGMPFFEPVTRSDEDGRFEIADLDPHGERYLQARAEGFVPRAPLKVAMPPEGEVRVAMDRARTLSGVVVTADEHEPIPEARLDLNREGRIEMGGMFVRGMVSAGSAMTGADGTFRVEGLAPGSLHLVVRAPGFRTANRNVTIPRGEDPTPLTIELERGYTVEGTVLDPDGVPVEGAQVTGGAGHTWSRTTSGPGGTFTLEGLARGTVEVRATDTRGREGRATAEAGSAEPVTVRLHPGSTITGTVTDTAGSPLAGAPVQAFRARGGDLLRGTTDAAGTFELGPVAPGSYRVAASAPGYAEATETVTVPEDGEPEPVHLELEEGRTIHGTVLGLSASELEKCTVWVSGGASGHPGPGGGITLDGVRPGTVTVNAMVLPGNRSRAVTLEVPAEGDVPEFEIDFGNGVTLSGTVTRRGEPVPGLQVRAANVTTGSSQATVTGEAGDYAFHGLDEGEYQVAVANASGQVLAGEHVALDSDTTLDIAISGAALSGLVLDADTGRPLSGATVTITGTGIPAVERTATAGDGGGFEVDELPAGTYTVRATTSGHSPAQEMVTIDEGVPARVTLRLPAEDVLRIQLTGGGSGSLWVTPMTQGIVQDTVTAECDASGLCELHGLAHGTYTLRIDGATGAALTTATMPSRQAIPVTLEPEGSLRILASPGDAGVVWNVRIRHDPTGLVVPVPSWRNPGRGEWTPVPEGGLRLSLPAGSYTVEAIAPDGATATGHAEVPPNGDATVSFPMEE